MISRSFIPASFRNQIYARAHFHEIVAWAHTHHPFYKKWLSDPKTSIPILTREDVLQNNETLLNGHPITTRTSGSTGVPVSISQSLDRCDMESQDTTRFANWLGGFVPRSVIVYTDGESDEQTLDIKASVKKQFEFIEKRYQESKAISLVTYPSNALILCEEALANGRVFPFIERVVCYAELFEPFHEKLINQVFPNAVVSTTYSSMEFGMIAARCPHEPAYHHIMAHKLGVEVLDDNDQPCIEGEVGRIVITDYFNRNMPFIRYDIGDLGSPGLCPCNKIDLPALSALIGKTRGALKHKNGERVVFAELSVAIRDIQGVKQYQVIQNSLESFDVLIVRASHIELSSIEVAVHAAFKTHFGYSTQINLVESAHIPRGENGKYYASICNI